MDPDFFFRHLRERLNPHLLNFLISSRHSVAIWDLQDQNGGRVRGSIVVLYDDSDLLTVIWDYGPSINQYGNRQHYHLCPDALRSYWHLLAVVGIPNPPPRQIFFSPRPERPYPCPQLFYLRERLERYRVRPPQVCMLPGPSVPNLDAPQGPRVLPLTARLPNLTLPPMVRHQLQISASALEAPGLVALLARSPPSVQGDQPLDFSTRTPTIQLENQGKK